jgi:hypothetical protein
LAGDRARISRKALRRATDGLCLAAAPTFTLMALASYLSGGGPGIPGMLCATMSGTSALSSMSLMYALMSAFHLTPWLKRISAGERHVRRL